MSHPFVQALRELIPYYQQHATRQPPYGAFGAKKAEILFYLTAPPRHDILVSLTAPTLLTWRVEVLSKILASGLSVRDARRVGMCCRALHSATEPSLTDYAGAVVTTLLDDDPDVRMIAFTYVKKMPESILKAHSGGIAAVLEHDEISLGDGFQVYSLLDCLPGSLIPHYEITIAAKLNDPSFRGSVLGVLSKLDLVSREKYIPDFIAALYDPYEYLYEPGSPYVNGEAAYEILEEFEPAVLEKHADALRAFNREHPFLGADILLEHHLNLPL